MTVDDLFAWLEENTPCGVTAREILQAGLDALDRREKEFSRRKAVDFAFRYVPRSQKKLRALTPGVYAEENQPAISFAELEKRVLALQIQQGAHTMGDPVDLFASSEFQPTTGAKCDCGGAKLNTTHSDWCSTKAAP